MVYRQRYKKRQVFINPQQQGNAETQGKDNLGTWDSASMIRMNANQMPHHMKSVGSGRQDV